MNFLNIEYLKEGNERQKLAYQMLVNHQIIEKLKAYHPILTGTIPINIDIETSDLDIICYWKDKHQFITIVTKLFAEKEDFHLREGTMGSKEIVVCNFKTADFEIEIFGQNIPTEKQNAYQHMLIEHQVLKEKGEDFRLKIVELKRNGYKTEPAFAKLLNLTGNPFDALLTIPLN